MWNKLTTLAQLEQIQDESKEKKILIFKHSTRCSISSAALSRLERNWKSDEMPEVKSYLLDLISFRQLSNEIESLYHIEHESPQVLIISNGKSVYDRSHLAIDYNQIKEAVKN